MTGTTSLSPVVMYHGLARRYLIHPPFLMRPLLSGGTLGGPLFSIELLPPENTGPEGERLGRIRIGDFSEVFPIASFPPPSIPDIWRAELRRLLDGASAVGLVFDPRFAWVLYRVEGHVYVQQQLVLADSPDSGMDGEGRLIRVRPREVVSEDGEEVSEWRTTTAALQSFLERDN